MPAAKKLILECKSPLQKAAVQKVEMMIPVLWRYLLAHYLKVLLFCTFAFIGLLLTLRLEEIAHFATLGPQGIYILYFTFYQIPYILPIALPLSALISSMILLRHLCKNHEMTALRAAGYSFSTILTPLLVASFFLAIANFYVVSELATSSHLSTSLIKNELRAINPLLLLSNKHLMRLRGVYFDTLGPSRLGESASDSIIAIPNKSSQRINLLIAKNLEASPESFEAETLTLLSTLSDDDGQYDPVFVENMRKSTAAIKDFAQMIQRKVWTLNDDHLQMSLLLCRLRENQAYLNATKLENRTAADIRQVQKNIIHIYAEMTRRGSIALAVFTFTLLGASCGLGVGRQQSAKRILLVSALSALYVAAYFAGKGVDHHFAAAVSFYTVPHLLMVMVSLWVLRKAIRGVE